MSGGHYDYEDYKIQSIADTLKEDIRKNRTENECGYAPCYSDETLDRLADIIPLLELAADLTHHADYLYSGDIGEEEFTKRYDETFETFRQVHGFSNACRCSYIEKELTKKK